MYNESGKRMLTLSTICPQKNDIYNKNNTNSTDNFNIT